MDIAFCKIIAQKQVEEAARLAEVSAKRRLSLPIVTCQVVNFLVSNENHASLNPPEHSIAVKCKFWRKTNPKITIYEGWYLGMGPISCKGESHILLTRDGEIIFFRPHVCGKRYSIISGINDDERYYAVSELSSRLMPHNN